MRLFPLNRRGQFVPIAANVVFAGVMLIVATVNVYRVTKAKLQAQNMADAAALAVAALEAKEINVVMDRDEWLNHMYSTPDSTHSDPNKSPRLPNISTADKGLWESGTTKAQYYAQLVATINKAQAMFMAAYENFYGVNGGPGGVQGQNAGPGGLQDVLSEITGLNDPSVTVMIYNIGNQDPQGAAQQARALAANQGSSASSVSDGSNIHAFNMRVPFKTVPVNFINTDDHNKPTSLKKVLNLPDDSPEIGWMRPVWDDPNMSMKVNTGSGQTTAIGATAIVVKKVPLMIPLVRSMYVTARATAYVDKSSGLSVEPNSPLTNGNPKAPADFRPTYFVRLGVPTQ